MLANSLLWMGYAGSYMMVPIYMQARPIFAPTSHLAWMEQSFSKASP